MSSLKKKIRDAFRAAVFGRDRHRCRKCGAEHPDLDAHHIVDRNELPNGGYVAENGISLCPDCHRKAEIFHDTGHAKWEEGFHPDDLFRLIGSSREKALAASERLNPRKAGGSDR